LVVRETGYGVLKRLFHTVPGGFGLIPPGDGYLPGWRIPGILLLFKLRYPEFGDYGSD